MILIGTSGYNYPEWKGSFYPADLPAAKMLAYYAGQFDTVEINYTFYRMPTPKLVAGWSAQVPDRFRFTLKAPRRITHDKRLRPAEVSDALRGFLTAAGELGPRMGALLFQLPPNFKKDVGVLTEFLTLLPPKVTAAFEFRHESWLSDDVYACLGEHNIALCIADSETRRRRCWRLPTTPTSACATKATRRRTCTAGPRRRASWAAAVETCSSTSSTRTKARAPRSVK